MFQALFTNCYSLKQLDQSGESQDVVRVLCVQLFWYGLSARGRDNDSFQGSCVGLGSDADILKGENRLWKDRETHSFKHWDAGLRLFWCRLSVPFEHHFVTHTTDVVASVSFWGFQYSSYAKMLLIFKIILSELPGLLFFFSFSKKSQEEENANTCR